MTTCLFVVIDFSINLGLMLRLSQAVIIISFHTSLQCALRITVFSLLPTTLPARSCRENTPSSSTACLVVIKFRSRESYVQCSPRSVPVYIPIFARSSNLSTLCVFTDARTQHHHTFLISSYSVLFRTTTHVRPHHEHRRCCVMVQIEACVNVSP